MPRRERGVFRQLLALTYDKDKVLCWRAVEAMGFVAAAVGRDDPAGARTLVQRLLWMMRDESGNNPWSVPEILGEIIRNSPDQFSDIAPILASFHDEEMLRKGVLRGLCRVGEVRPDLIAGSSELAAAYLCDPDPGVRAYAALLAGILGLRSEAGSLAQIKDDPSAVRLYRDGDFLDTTVGEIAGGVMADLQKTGDAGESG
jgi:hypothetical protein